MITQRYYVIAACFLLRCCHSEIKDDNILQSCTRYCYYIYF